MNTDCYFELIFKPGATIHTASKEILSARLNHYNLVLLFAGVNNLTRKESNNRVSMFYHETPEAVDHLTDDLTFAKQFLKCFADHVILCHLIGLDLRTYNMHFKNRQLLNTTSSQTNLFHMNTKRSNTADYSEEQAILNDICVTLNQTITLINDDDGLQSPFIQDTIHCLVRKKRVHKYIRFGDGLHPDTDTVKLWAKVFAKGIHKNLSNLKLI